MPSKKIISLEEKLIKLFFENDLTEFMLLTFQTILNFIMTYEAKTIIESEQIDSNNVQRRYLNGFRVRKLKSRLGEATLKVPRFRSGRSYFPSFLSRYERTEQALIAVIQEAYINGVSTRKMEQVLEQMGIKQMSSTTVSRLCDLLLAEVEKFKSRPILRPVPYLYLDATYFKTTKEGLNCLLIAYGVNEAGRREILGFELVASESEYSWDGFISSLKNKGLSGVDLVISDAHAGLKKAISKQLLGAKWQRCLVHFQRNVLDTTPKKLKDKVIKKFTDFRNAKTKELARQEYHQLIAFLSGNAKAVKCLEDAEQDLLHYFDFPETHHCKIRSTNLLERVNREIKRRTNSVGVFFSGESILRLVGQVLIAEQNKWNKTSRCYIDMTEFSEFESKKKEKQLLIKNQKAEKAA